MAKKAKQKAATKAAPKKAPKKAKGRFGKKATFDGAKARAKQTKTAPRRKSAEQIDLLPGVRYAELDRYCRSMGDRRDEMTASRNDDAAEMQGALKAMRARGCDVYKSYGMTLLVVKGDQRLKVMKDRATSHADGGQVDTEFEEGNTDPEHEEASDEALAEAAAADLEN